MSASRSTSSHRPLKIAALNAGPAARPFDVAGTKKSSIRGGGVTR